MKTSEILIEAKKHLSTDALDGKTVFVCFAICKTPRSDKRDALLHRINVAVGGSNRSVIGWLRAEGHITRNQVLTLREQQDYRHRWVDSLIAEYQAKGD